jgi:hypothetical protein
MSTRLTSRNVIEHEEREFDPQHTPADWMEPVTSTMRSTPGSG